MLTIVALVLYAGYDETMKIITYLDLQYQHFMVKVQMKMIGWKLKRQLVKETTDFQKFLKEYKNDQ
jgi:hypothetical protein